MFNKQSTACPAVWSEISTTLTAQFLADGQCTDAARAAIRGSFHDCFNGACDGSLILANECANPENRGLERLCGNLGNLAQQKQVGVADLIQFAAAHAVKTCPGGPTVPVKVGRPDSREANAMGVLPSGFANGGDLVKLFASKGFSPMDLAALIGAHTTAKQRVTDPSKGGASLDSTVGTWDNKYYQETKNGKAPFTLQSDKNIASHPLTALPFTTFGLSKGAWDSAFVSAMTKMSMLGVSGKGLIDCTSALPGGSRKREIKSSNIFDRLKW
ncbi:heme peroxidase [Ophiobolus disseminans]|uniref:Peroxidase n=1 Tax=Ophiobolus disseminans TaxID=1469910 RepID=A0A6A7A162_9PLEO|nr:heme peroxidase [Ophiobolus disseminans]